MTHVPSTALPESSATTVAPRRRHRLSAALASALLAAPLLATVTVPLPHSTPFGSFTQPLPAVVHVGKKWQGSRHRLHQVRPGVLTTADLARRRQRPSPSPALSPASTSAFPSAFPSASPSTSPSASPSASPAASPSPAAAPAPSAARGVDAGYVPVGDVALGPDQLTQSVLDGAAAGTRFTLAAGTYRLSSPLVLRAGQQLLGAPGAVLSGAGLLSDWVREADAWHVDGQTTRLPAKAGGPAPCASWTTLCNNAEDVFRDDVPLRQVASRAELAPGTFYFDYTGSAIYVAEDPTGHRLETTRTGQAVNAPGGGVLQNLVVEKFGNPAQAGAIGGNHVDVVHCVVRLNHGVGVMTYGGSVVGSVIGQNGQLGLGAGGDDMLVAGNEIVGNNTAGYDPGWEAGGTKWVDTNRLVVRSNWSHDNHGNGLWTDIDNDATTYENNLVEHNDGIGIFQEISYSARIVGNTVRDNGLAAGYFNSRAGINVTNSPHVEVTGNTLSGNAGGSVLVVQDTRTGSGRLGPHVLADVSVHDNAAGVTGGYQGLWVYDSVPDRATYYTSRGIVFSHNTYRLPSLTTKLFLGGDAGLGSAWDKAWATWLSLGQDVGSAAITG